MEMTPLRRMEGLARLFRTLEDQNATRQERIDTIKVFRDDGYITTDEALELVFMYC